MPFGFTACFPPHLSPLEAGRDREQCPSGQGGGGAPPTAHTLCPQGGGPRAVSLLSSAACSYRGLPATRRALQSFTVRSLGRWTEGMVGSGMGPAGYPQKQRMARLPKLPKCGRAKGQAPLRLRVDCRAGEGCWAEGEGLWLQRILIPGSLRCCLGLDAPVSLSATWPWSPGRLPTVRARREGGSRGAGGGEPWLGTSEGRGGGGVKQAHTVTKPLRPKWRKRRKRKEVGGERGWAGSQGRVVARPFMARTRRGRQGVSPGM